MLIYLSSVMEAAVLKKKISYFNFNVVWLDLSEMLLLKKEF